MSSGAKYGFGLPIINLWLEIWVNTKRKKIRNRIRNKKETGDMNNILFISNNHISVVIEDGLTS